MGAGVHFIMGRLNGCISIFESVDLASKLTDPGHQVLIFGHFDRKSGFHS
jgi:hypothetical protein